VRIREYLRPSSLEEASALLRGSEDNRIVGGLTALKLANASIGTAIDLSDLGLDYVRSEGGRLRLGAYASLRSVELSPLCRASASGILARAAGRVGGVQLRSQVTLGGAVSSRWAISEILAALLALDAELSFFGAGRVGLGAYLEKPVLADILVEVSFADLPRRGSLRSARISYLDYPLLAVAVAVGEGRPGGARIVSGARPARSRLAEGAMRAFEAGADPRECGEIASGELDFGDDARASAEYRRRVCAKLAERALAEATE
jgi:CO/xanthine dehydrogenase FAD-binding subunit